MIPVGGSALDSLNRNPRISRLDTLAVVGLPGYYGNQDLPKQLFHNHIIEGSEHSLTHGVISRKSAKLHIPEGSQQLGNQWVLLIWHLHQGFLVSIELREPESLPPGMEKLANQSQECCLCLGLLTATMEVDCNALYLLTSVRRKLFTKP